MKFFSLFTIVIIVEVMFQACAFGQSATANSTATATIVQPVNIIKVRDMNFGKCLFSATPGTVVLDPSEAGIRTAGGGVSLLPGSSTVNCAKFNVSGAEGYSFTIKLPTSPIILSNGTNFVTVDNFTSAPSGPATFTPGALSILVGATLNVNANQEPGVYISTGDFKVTINYN